MPKEDREAYVRQVAAALEREREPVAKARPKLQASSKAAFATTTPKAVSAAAAPAKAFPKAVPKAHFSTATSKAVPKAKLSAVASQLSSRIINQVVAKPPSKATAMALAVAKASGANAQPTHIQFDYTAEVWNTNVYSFADFSLVSQMREASLWTWFCALLYVLILLLAISKLVDLWRRNRRLRSTLVDGAIGETQTEPECTECKPVKLPARRRRTVFRGASFAESDNPHWPQSSRQQNIAYSTPTAELAAHAADSSTDSEMPDIEFIDAPYALYDPSDYVFLFTKWHNVNLGDVKRDCIFHFDPQCSGMTSPRRYKCNFSVFVGVGHQHLCSRCAGGANLKLHNGSVAGNRKYFPNWGQHNIRHGLGALAPEPFTDRNEAPRVMNRQVVWVYCKYPIFSGQKAKHNKPQGMNILCLNKICCRRRICANSFQPDPWACM